MTAKYKVFISHSSIDTWVAKQIARYINDLGAATFLDVEDIDHDDDVDEQILVAAASADELLVLLTPWSKSRPYVLMETGIFWGSRRRIVSVLHGLGPKKIPEPLQNLKFIDINEIDSYFQRLKKRVKHKEGES